MSGDIKHLDTTTPEGLPQVTPLNYGTLGYHNKKTSHMGQPLRGRN